MSYRDDNYRDAPPPIPDRQGYDERYPEDRDRYAPPGEKKKGCSKGCIYGLAGCGCVTVLAIIGLVALLWPVVNAVLKGTSTDPAVIKTRTLEMTEITPPAGLEPKMAMNVLVAKVVFYQSADGQSQLSLVQIDPKFAPKGANKNQEFGEGFRKGFGNGGQGGEHHEVKIEKSEVKEMKLRGQTSKVKFSDGKTEDGKEFKIVEAEFQGKVGVVEMQLQMPAEKYDEDEVNKFLESIK